MRSSPPPPPPPRRTRLAIVGAGPHGLAVALHLLEQDPRLIDDLVVLDPSGRWLAGWDERFARLGIEHLRSPGVHHPGPDPHDLAAWLGPDAATTGLPYGIPPTTGFRRYCAHLVADSGLTDLVHPAHVVDLRVAPDRSQLTLAGGAKVVTDHTVVAIDPARRRIPDWVDGVLPCRPDLVQHAGDVDLRTFGRNGLRGQRVAIIGGALTAGHLAVGAVAAGAHVTVIARRPLRERMFDTDPGWLGPLELRGYRAEPDPAERVRAALRARDGGSIPPWMLRRLRQHRADGAVELADGTDVEEAAWSDDRIRLRLRTGDLVLDPPAFDRLWLATGSRPHVDAHPLTRRLRQAAPAPVVEGWPVLDESDLRWPGTAIHLTGRMAMIPLGPAAGNLWGARVAARRIADAIVAGDTGRDLRAVA